MDSRYLMNTYDRLPVAFERGQGAWLFDAGGRRYLDAISGIGVCSLGHAHPTLAEAICDQAHTLIHTANLGHIRLQQQLAERLCTLADMDGAFITNTGAEAIECAFKLARRHGHARGVESPQILVADGAFHGRTLAAISASAPGKLQQGFEPVVPGFVRVPFGDATAAAVAMDNNPDLVAMLVEPIQGEGGVRIPPAGYLEALRSACDRHRVLLICDEIQTGLCRTGRWFAHQHEPASRPDVITVAKALGNGVPVAACLARGSAAQLFTPGSHGTTFGGSPLACRAALTVLQLMEQERLAERAAARGAELMAKLCAGLDSCRAVHEIRGRGLMIGIELNQAAAGIRQAALADGVLINVTRERVIRLLPPLIIDAEQVRQLAELLIATISQCGES